MSRWRRMESMERTKRSFIEIGSSIFQNSLLPLLSRRRGSLPSCWHGVNSLLPLLPRCESDRPNKRHAPTPGQPLLPVLEFQSSIFALFIPSPFFTLMKVKCQPISRWTGSWGRSSWRTIDVVKTKKTWKARFHNLFSIDDSSYFATLWNDACTLFGTIAFYRCRGGWLIAASAFNSGVERSKVESTTGRRKTRGPTIENGDRKSTTLRLIELGCNSSPYMATKVKRAKFAI